MTQPDLAVLSQIRDVTGGNRGRAVLDDRLLSRIGDNIAAAQDHALSVSLKSRPMEMRRRSFQVTTGNALRCKGWRQEGLLRLLENVLAVGEDPDNLVVYAALGRAARDWPSHERIVATLKTMDDGETLLVQSGKPIGVIKTHARAPVVLMANCNIVGQWAKAETFYELEKKNLICWGGLTAGDWQYIGSQGVIQGTYEIFMRIAERHFGGDLAGR